MLKSVKRLKEEIYVRLTGNFVEGRTELDFLSNTAIVKLFEKQVRDAVRKYGYPELTAEQEAEIKEYYKGFPKFDTIYHRSVFLKRGRKNETPDGIYPGLRRADLRGKALLRHGQHRPVRSVLHEYRARRSQSF